MRIKLDENLGESAAAALIDAGHDVCTVPAQGLSGCDDYSLAQRCAKEERALVSLDMGFANPYEFKPDKYRCRDKWKTVDN